MKCPRCDAEVQNVPLGPGTNDLVCFSCGWTRNLDGKNEAVDHSRAGPTVTFDPFHPGYKEAFERAKRDKEMARVGRDGQLTKEQFAEVQADRFADTVKALSDIEYKLKKKKGAPK